MARICTPFQLLKWYITTQLMQQKRTQPCRLQEHTTILHHKAVDSFPGAEVPEFDGATLLTSNYQMLSLLQLDAAHRISRSREKPIAARFEKLELGLPPL